MSARDPAWICRSSPNRPTEQESFAILLGSGRWFRKFGTRSRVMTAWHFSGGYLCLWQREADEILARLNKMGRRAFVVRIGRIMPEAGR